MPLPTIAYKNSIAVGKGSLPNFLPPSKRLVHWWLVHRTEDNMDSKTACQARVDHVQRMFEKPPGPSESAVLA